MITLKIILTVIGSIAYLVAIFFATSAYFELHRWKSDMMELKHMMMDISVRQRCECLKSYIQEIENMKEHLQELVDHEEFEKAEKLANAIAKMDANVKKAIDMLKEQYGDIIEVVKISSDGKRTDN